MGCYAVRPYCVRRTSEQRMGDIWGDSQVQLDSADRKKVLTTCVLMLTGGYPTREPLLALQEL